MKQLLSLAVGLATLLGLFAVGPAAVAQEAGGLAIIDMSYIFKEHARFKALTAKMKAEVKAAEDELKNRRTALQNKAAQLKEFDKGSPDYKALERQVTEEQAALQADVALKKKEFLDREAGIYYQVYGEILDAVKKVAVQNRIDLVLRFNGEPVDPNDPQGVLKELNKTVVYYNRAIDITEIILNEVNRSSGAPRTGSKPGSRQTVPPKR